MLRYINYLYQYYSGGSPVDMFLADPTSFLQDYVVLPDQAGLQRGIVALTLTPYHGLQARKPDGTLSPIYRLEQAGGPAGAIRAFWCPYVEDSTRSVVIDQQADLVFTAMMDGCSLGVGNRTAGGQYLVSHANRGVVGNAVVQAGGTIAAGQAAQRQAQLTSITQRMGGPAAHVVAPVQYMVDPVSNQEELKATTFGVRDTGTDRWTFYCQRYEALYGAPVAFRLVDLLLVHQT